MDPAGQRDEEKPQGMGHRMHGPCRLSNTRALLTQRDGKKMEAIIHAGAEKCATRGEIS
jgi:hypothetical protein